MPKFLDLFVREIHKKRSRLKERLEKGQVSSLDSDFKDLLIKNWHPLPERETTDVDLVAVDGSRAVREYANGSRFYVVRAFGQSNNGRKSRALETEVFLSRGNEQSIRSYISQKIKSSIVFTARGGKPKTTPYFTANRFYLLCAQLYGKSVEDPPVRARKVLVSINYLN